MHRHAFFDDGLTAQICLVCRFYCVMASAARPSISPGSQSWTATLRSQ